VTQPTQSTAAAPAKEATAAPIKPGGPGDTWVQAVGDDGSGHPLIHSLRNHALELPGRDRFRWRIGVTWRFPHALANGMPGPQDRLPMNAVDDAIHEIFEHDDANRIVYFTTGGGMREVMLYGSDEAERSLCTQLDANKATLRALPGAHHFDGDYEALAKLVR